MTRNMRIIVVGYRAAGDERNRMYESDFELTSAYL